MVLIEYEGSMNNPKSRKKEENEGTWGIIFPQVLSHGGIILLKAND